MLILKYHKNGISFPVIEIAGSPILKALGDIYNVMLFRAPLTDRYLICSTLTFAAHLVVPVHFYKLSLAPQLRKTEIPAMVNGVIALRITAAQGLSFRKPDRPPEIIEAVIGDATKDSNKADMKKDHA